MSETSRPYRVRRRTAAAAAGSLAVIVLAIATYMALNTGGAAVAIVQKTATSKDGTLVAYERTGTGPVAILVACALADRAGTTGLAKSLAGHFTVVNYDRRGRGKSTDTQPYAVEREVEDIDALIGASGGSAFVFGSSSGAVLALEAASKLGSKVTKLFLY